MKPKFFRQIVLPLFILACGAWALYEYTKSKKEQEIKAKEAALLDEDIEDLKVFRIVKKIGDTKEKLEVVSENNTWQIKSPIADQASWTEISRWFDEIKNQKVQKITPKESFEWKSYYLEDAPRVEMEFSSNNVVSFSVSHKSTFDRKYFIRKQEDLFLGEKYLYSEINTKDFYSFRDKKLIPSFGHAEKIEFKGKTPFSLYWQDHQWSLSAFNEDVSVGKEESSSDTTSKKTALKDDFPLNTNTLDNFWTTVSSMEASAIKERISPSYVKKYKLQKPHLEVAFFVPPDKKYSLKLSPFIEDKAYILASNRDFIFEISKEEAKKLILSKNDIRDHNFPFKLDIASAFQIERKSTREKQNFVIQKDLEQWVSLSPKDFSEQKNQIDEDKTAETTDDKAAEDKKEESSSLVVVEGKKEDIQNKKVEDLLKKIKDLKGEKYKPAGKLKKSVRRSLTVKNEGLEVVFYLQEVAESGTSHVWLATNLWQKEWVGIAKKHVDAIFDLEVKAKTSDVDIKPSDKESG